MTEVRTQFVEGAEHEFQIVRTQDVEPIVDYAKAMHNLGQGNGADLKHAAEIPMVIVEAYMARTGVTWAEFTQSQDHIKAIVNDPALQAYRIWQGRV
jgi:hypothetical protein